MAFSLDNLLGIHPQALRVRSQRMQIIASNLANADTPGYLARDVDFREVLDDEQAAPVRARRTHARHLVDSQASFDDHLRYRVPLQPAMDGNTVDAQFEQTAFADNAVRYQASLMFLNGRIRGISDAITGGLR